MLYCLRVITFFLCILFFIAFTSGISFAQYGTGVNLHELVRYYPTTAPFVTIEGVGGGGLIPHAHLVNTPFWPFPESDLKPIRKPKLSFWWITLPDADLNWLSTGIATTLFDRLEIGFANNYVNIDEPYIAEQVGLDLDMDMFSVTSKLLLIKESTYIPAVSVGMMYKHTNLDTPEAFKEMGSSLYSNNSGFDFYAVASKIVFLPLPKILPTPYAPQIIQDADCIPLPLHLTFGVKSTKSASFGLNGFGNDRDAVFFGSAQLVIPPDMFLPWDFLKGSLLFIGAEYIEGYDAGHNTIDGIGDELKTDRQWDIHLVWDNCKNFSIILAYLDTGNNNLQSNLEAMENPSAQGEGFVLSLQYQF